MKKYELIRFYTCQNEPMHSHSEIECIYVLAGDVVINIQGTEYRPKEKDFVIVNSGELHGWNCAKNGLVCIIQMDYYDLKQVAGEEAVYFACNSMADKQTDYRKIRYILDCIVKNSSEEKDGFLVQSLYYTFWECVKNQYIADEMPKSFSIRKNERADRVIQDIREHYDEPISLQSLAEKWFLSESAVSRMVKRVTGVKFVDFLRNVRLEHAKEALLHTEKSITEIAYECGFSNPSVFHKNFKSVFQLSPGAFRSSTQLESDNGGENAAAETLKTYLNKVTAVSQVKVNNQHHITIDCSNYKIREDAMQKCVNAGMAIDLLEQRVQTQVLDVVQNLGIACIRIQNLFDWELEIRDKHEAEQYNFDKVDIILDFCIENDVIPLIELPEKLKKKISAINSGQKVSEKYMEPIISSINDLEMLLSAFLEHVIDRYTSQTVDTWMFEIVFDIEKKTGAGKLPFEEMYLSVFHCIRDYLPEAKIGASELNSEMNISLLKQQITWWKGIDERPDFLSIMCYPYHVNQLEGAEKLHLINIVSDQHFVREELQKYKEVLTELEYPKTPIWITEWNTSLAERNYYNDSCVKGCHMLKQMVDAVGEADAMSFGIVSDCHARFLDAKAPITGGSGLISKDGLRKPSYYAMEFWKYLGEYFLKRGENYIATTREDGAVSILLFNGQSFNENYQLKDEDEFSVRELPSLFRELETQKLSIHLNHMKNGRRKISTYRVRESEGNLLAEWEKMKYVETLTKSEVSYLQKICIPRMERSWLVIEDGIVDLEVEVERNEMQLILIF